MQLASPLSRLFFALAAVAVFTFSYYLGNRYAHPRRGQIQAFAFPDPVKVAPFRLVDKEGNPFTEADLLGHWNFVVTGDLDRGQCRTLLFRYVLAWNDLAARPKLQRKTRVVFLALGRKSRSPAELKKFIDFFNLAFTAIDGAPAQKEALARQLGVPESALRDGVRCDSQNGVVALIDPKGFLLALFTGVTDPAVIAHDLRYFQ